MTSKNRVIWKEGLFVKPQHFQQETRALSHDLHRRLSAIAEYGYGFSELELNTEYMSFGKIALLRARGVMPDGTVFDIPADMPAPPPLAITDASLVNQVIYLTLPLTTESALEVQWPQDYGRSRYLAQIADVRDTHSPDGDHVSLDVAALNLQLGLDRDDRSAFTGLALGRLQDVRPDGSLIMDETFYPTSLSLQAVAPLKRFLGEIAGLMRERAKSIAARIGSPTQGGVADVTDFSLLQALNRLQPYFQHLAAQHHVHPERVYVAFAQACGELVTFTDEGRLPQQFAAYRHDRLRESFTDVEQTLRRVLSTVLQPRAVSIPIIAQQYGMLTAPVHDRRLFADAEFILAVRARMPVDTFREQFLQRTKIASMDTISERVSLQLPGIPLIPLPVAPRHLPFHAGFSYFEMDRTHKDWQAMHDSAGFGFHIAGDFPDLEMQLWAIRSA
jgi:type VI secretion system protein ImpJ